MFVYVCDINYIKMLIVPAFEILENARDPTFPRDKPHLLTQWRLGNIHQFQFVLQLCFLYIICSQ